jgi:hypothetical protein
MVAISNGIPSSLGLKSLKLSKTVSSSSLSLSTGVLALFKDMSLRLQSRVRLLAMVLCVRMTDIKAGGLLYMRVSV